MNILMSRVLYLARSFRRNEPSNAGEQTQKKQVSISNQCCTTKDSKQTDSPLSISHSSVLSLCSLPVWPSFGSNITFQLNALTICWSVCPFPFTLANPAYIYVYYGWSSIRYALYLLWHNGPALEPHGLVLHCGIHYEHLVSFSNSSGDCSGCMTDTILRSLLLIFGLCLDHFRCTSIVMVARINPSSLSFLDFIQKQDSFL